MLPLTTLHDVLTGAPQTPALIVTGGGPTVTRQQLMAAVVDTALSLQRAGIKPGQVVSMAYANTVRSSNRERERGNRRVTNASGHFAHQRVLQADFVVAFLGVTFARAVAAPLNAAYKLVSVSLGFCHCGLFVFQDRMQLGFGVIGSCRWQGLQAAASCHTSCFMPAAACNFHHHCDKLTPRPRDTHAQPRFPPPGQHLLQAAAFASKPFSQDIQSSMTHITHTSPVSSPACKGQGFLLSGRHVMLAAACVQQDLHLTL